MASAAVSERKRGLKPDATLYAYWRSSASWRVRIALYWKQIPFEYKAVHLVKNGGEQFSAAYSELNPMKLVPTLLIDSHVLTESRAIIEYLEETRPEHPLLPKDPYLRAKARQLADIVTSDTQPLQNLRVLNKLTADFGASQEQKNAWARHWIDTSFQAIEVELKKCAGKFCVGDEVSVADVCLAPQIYNARRFGVDLSKFPTIVAVEKNFEVLAAFRDAHAERQPDAEAAAAAPPADAAKQAKA